MTNVFSVDVEDYFHANVFSAAAPSSSWDRLESRVVANTDRVLDLLAETKVTGTFFVLGWVAERHPDLVRRIAAHGHELASHSYWHRQVFTLTPDEFREDLRRARGTIEAASGCRVRGYRAPSFSIVTRSLWALDVMIEEGYAYDASIFPVKHDRYGIPDAPRVAHRITSAAGSLLEIPGTVVRRGPLSVPVGGGYFRLLPYAVTRWAVATFNREVAQPAIFYVHPWEVDPDQPRLPVSAVNRVRHYRGLGDTADRMRDLVRRFRFGPIAEVFAEQLGLQPVAVQEHAS